MVTKKGKHRIMIIGIVLVALALITYFTSFIILALMHLDKYSIRNTTYSLGYYYYPFEDYSLPLFILGIIIIVVSLALPTKEV